MKTLRITLTETTEDGKEYAQDALIWGNDMFDLKRYPVLISYLQEYIDRDKAKGWWVGKEKK